jgi:hypothetical protein
MNEATTTLTRAESQETHPGQGYLALSTTQELCSRTLPVGAMGLPNIYNSGDQLAVGLAPPGVRPCWVHHKKTPHLFDGAFLV